MEKDKKLTEEKIAGLIRAFEIENEVVVSAINFKRQSMCDKKEQKIKTWSVELAL